MKRFHISTLLIALLVFVFACGGSGVLKEHMLFNDDTVINVFNVKPEKGKAALVVARTDFYAAKFGILETYLDKRLIGVTEGKSYFVTYDVAPGVHYVIMRMKKQSAGKRYAITLKTNFKSGSIYYIKDNQLTLSYGTSTYDYQFVSPAELNNYIDKKCKWVVYDKSNPGDDMSDADYREAVHDYEQHVRTFQYGDSIRAEPLPWYKR
jgi:hypothetical protein